jgi:hypothetical protein
MWKRFLEWLKAAMPLSYRASLYAPRMPEVEVLPNIEGLFEHARQVAAGKGTQPPGPAARHVVIVTPGRMLRLQPCPPPGSIPRPQVAAMEQMMAPQIKRNVVAIACTEGDAGTIDLTRAIPFLGILLGLAYIGHAVWVFEGHASALAAGCKEADVLIVDGGMLPHLAVDWAVIAAPGHA